METSCVCLSVADGIVTYQWSIRDTGIEIRALEREDAQTSLIIAMTATAFDHGCWDECASGEAA